MSSFKIEKHLRKLFIMVNKEEVKKIKEQQKLLKKQEKQKLKEYNDILSCIKNIFKRKYKRSSNKSIKKVKVEVIEEIKEEIKIEEIKEVNNNKLKKCNPLDFGTIDFSDNDDNDDNNKKDNNNNKYINNNNIKVLRVGYEIDIFGRKINNNISDNIEEDNIIFGIKYYNKDELINKYKDVKCYMFEGQYLNRENKTCRYFIAYENCDKLKEDNNLFEILINNNKLFKLYFDIESKDKNFLDNYNVEQRDNLIKRFVYVFLEFLNKSSLLKDDKRNDLINSIMIMRSKNEEMKMSYHIIFNEITFNNIQYMKDFIKIFINSNIYREFESEIKQYNINIPDIVPYQKNQSFRTINQSKIGLNNKLVLIDIFNKNINNKIEDCLIMSDKEGFINLIKNIEDNSNNNIIDNTTNNNKINYIEKEKNIIEIDNNQLRNLLNNLSIKRASYYDEWIKVFFCLRNININLIDLFIEFSKKTDRNNFDENYINNLWYKYNYDNSNKLGYGTLLKMYKEDNGKDFSEIFKIGINEKEENIKKLLNLYYNIDNIEDDRIIKYKLKLDELDEGKFLKSDLLLNHDEKIILLKSHLGTGKSCSFISLINKCIENKMSILIMSPRILYAVSNRSELMKKINNKNIKFTLYNEKQGNLYDDHLIIQCESLTRIKRTYDIIICDELEGILERFNNRKCHIDYINNYETFYNLLKNCKKFIGCDAFLNNTSINLVKNIFEEDIKLIINDVNPYKREAYEFDKFDDIYKNSCFNLKENKKIVIFCSSKNKCKQLEEHYKKEFVNKSIIVHHADKLYSEEKKILENVNDNWKVDILIYNSKITVGINMNIIDHFDEIYIISGNYVLVRDIMQASLRIRHLKDNTLKYFLYEQDSDFIFNYKMIEDDINDKFNYIKKYTGDNIDLLYEVPLWLKHLMINLKYEQNLNKYFFKSTFKYFLKWCGYELCCSDYYIWDTKFDKNCNVNYSYKFLCEKKEELFENKSDREIREYIQTNQKKSSLNNIYHSHIKDLIDFNNCITNINELQEEKIEELFSIYTNSHNHKYFDNIKYFESFKDNINDAQTFFNEKNRYNMDIIRPIGEQLNIIKYIFDTFNLYDYKEIEIKKNDIYKINQYLIDNEKKIYTLFKIRYTKNNVYSILKSILSNWCGYDIHDSKKYGGSVKKENKNITFKCIFDNVKIKTINSNYNNNDNNNDLFID